MRKENFDIHHFIEALRGTGDSINSKLESEYEMGEDDLTNDELSQIDEEIFECDICGWWCERVEEAEEPFCGTCESCAEDQREEENE